MTGLFKKKGNDLNKRWKNAYQPNSSLYRNDKGSIVVACALAEDTDSILPLVPEEEWAMEGVEINKRIISVVSITKADVIGQLEYHEGIKRLEPYFLDVRDGWALIRGLNLDEMDALFERSPREIL